MSGTEQILRRSLAELREREGKLLPFIEELEDVRRGIKTLERALGIAPAARSKNGSKANGGSPALSPRARFSQRVLDALDGALDGLALDDIAKALDRDADGYLRQIVQGLEAKGQVVELGGGRYGLASPIGAEASS